MLTVSIAEAKSNWSKLVRSVETGAETEIIILRKGQPVAHLVPIAPPRDTSKRIGLLDGLYPDITLEEFDADNEEIAAFFYGEID